MRKFFGRLLRGCIWALAVLAIVTVVPVLLMRWWNPVGSAFMVEARVAAWFDGSGGYSTRYQWVDFNRMAPEAALAVMAAEDQRFPYHHGFDFKSIQQALRAGEDGRPIRGASTITQQVAKNLFLWPGRSFVRKGLEAWLTVLIELLWPKQRILEVYLNIAEFGRGIYGVEAASRRYFGKPAARLDAYQAALLAAVLPNPRRLRVERPSSYVLSRQRWIAQQMRMLGGRSYLRELAARTVPSLQPLRLA